MKAILIAAALCAAIAVPAAAEHGGKGKHKGHRPDVIQLPNNFNPEGIATAKRHTFFVGSRDTGAIYRGSLRTGEGSILVEGGPAGLPTPDDRAATGMKVDRRGRLFVSGADSKHIRVYDARTGAQLRDYSVGDDAGFINDVIVTKRGAYFTDSNNPRLYFIPFGKKGALGDLETIPITGDFVFGPGFNANGIEAAKGGDVLILVKSSDPGKLYTADPETGVTKEIALDQPVTNGDGLLRKGRKLYVVLNQNDTVRVLRLSKNLSRATTIRDIKSDEFVVPTTIARSGGRNYVVNAKFNRPNPDNSFEVVRVPKK
jgi:sugar lactone lactonase YvrE